MHRHVRGWEHPSSTTTFLRWKQERAAGSPVGLAASSLVPEPLPFLFLTRAWELLSFLSQGRFGPCSLLCFHLLLTFVLEEGTRSQRGAASSHPWAWAPRSCFGGKSSLLRNQTAAERLVWGSVLGGAGSWG